MLIQASRRFVWVIKTVTLGGVQCSTVVEHSGGEWGYLANPIIVIPDSPEGILITMALSTVMRTSWRKIYIFCA